MKFSPVKISRKQIGETSDGIRLNQGDMKGGHKWFIF